MAEEILSREDKENILKALQDAQYLRKEIARAKRAGIDVSEIEKRLADAELALTNLKRVYITGK